MNIEVLTVEIPFSGIEALDIQVTNGTIPETPASIAAKLDSDLTAYANAADAAARAALINAVTTTGDQTVSGKKIVDFREEVANLGNSGTAKTLTLAATVQQTTLTGNCTFTMPAVAAGKSFLLDVIANGTAYTATFTGVDFGGTTPTLRTGSGDRNTFAFRANVAGTAWLGMLSGSGGGGGGTVDSTIIDGSTNAVSGNAVFDAMALKAPASGIDPSSITGTAVTLTGTQTITGVKRFPAIELTASTLSGQHGSIGNELSSDCFLNLPETAASYIAATDNTDGTISANTLTGTVPSSALGNAAPARRLLTGVGPHNALVGDRLTLYNASTVARVNDPTGTAAGQQYTLIVQLGTTNFNGSGTVFSASRFEIVRSYNGSSWSTVPAVVSGDITATSIGATTPGTGAFTTVTASGAGVFGSLFSQNHTQSTTLNATVYVSSPVIYASLLKMGGDSASFPSIKRNGTEINIRLANDSADAALRASNLTASGTVTATGGIIPGTFTVGTFPSTTYLSAVVTDALAPVVGATVASGGSEKAIVCYNGTSKIVTAVL